METETIIASFIGAIPILYLLGRLYSDLRGKERSGLLNLDEVKENVRKSNGFFEWLVPIAVSSAFIYNIVATAAWMAAELVQIVLHAAKWLFTQVFLTGPWFLAKMAWHYLVVWPWRLLSMAFGQILPSITRSQFITAFTGIALSLSIYFIGTIDSEGPEWFKYLMSVLSIFPLGWAVGKIGLEANGSSYSKDARNKYFKHLGLLVVLFGVLTGLEAFLINLGTYTSMSSALSQLFMFGTFWGSALLIFNGLILLFAISALPFVSAGFDGSNKDLLSEMWNHIKVKGLRYVVALPMMIVPIFILSFIPTMLTEGVNHLSNTISNEVYTDRLDSLDIVTPGELDWSDLSVSEDSISDYIGEWKDFYSATVNKRAIELDRNAVSSILGSNSDETGAVPYYAFLGLVDTLNQAQASAITTDRISIGTSDLTDVTSGDTAWVNSRVANTEDALVAANNRLDRANERKEAICNPDTTKALTTPVADTPADNDPASKGMDAVVITNCDRAQASVDNAAQNVTDAEETNARAVFFAAQLADLHDHVEGLSSSSDWSSKLAWAFGSLFLAFLFALQFGLAFVLFARVNGRIYAEGGDDSIVFMEGIRTMQSENKNQPLLGLGITALLFLMYTGNSLLSYDLPDPPSPVRSSIDMGVDLYDDVVGLDMGAFDAAVEAGIDMGVLEHAMEETAEEATEYMEEATE